MTRARGPSVACGVARGNATCDLGDRYGRTRRTRRPAREFRGPGLNRESPTAKTAKKNAQAFGPCAFYYRDASGLTDGTEAPKFHDTESGRRDSNPRRQPWQGCTLPLSYSRGRSDVVSWGPKAVKDFSVPLWIRPHASFREADEGRAHRTWDGHSRRSKGT